jgi:hypothetical protein
MHLSEIDSRLVSFAVIPAKAGIQLSLQRVMTQSGIPAFAGMTVVKNRKLRPDLN